jgi:hypothetical protein
VVDKPVMDLYIEATLHFANLYREMTKQGKATNLGKIEKANDGTVWF